MKDSRGFSCWNRPATPEVTRYYFWSLPLTLAAVFLGRFINQRLRSGAFLRCIYIGLFCVGNVLLVQSLITSSR